MKKLAFIGNSEPPSKLLEIWRKQTPGRSGIWGQLEGIANYKDADYFMVVDVLPSGLGIDPKKCIFLGAHPPGMKPYADMSNYTCLAKADCKDMVGFLEWWIKYDYDYLKALQAPTKTKLLGAVMSNADTMPHHKSRKDWLKRFCQRDNLDFNLHGRIQPDNKQIARYYRGACGSWDPRGAAASGGNDHMSGKEQFYLDHKYVFEFDAVGRHYFSERILDSMLLWAMPLYWGGEGMHEVLPPESFRYLNINGDGQDMLDIVNSGFYEQHIGDLTKARDILLDELQLWPRTHKLIFGTNR
jgi:hypothetical protein